MSPIRRPGRLSQIRLRPQSTINSYQTAALDFEWAASDAFSLKFGQPLFSTPEEYAADIDREQAKWGLLIKKLGLRVD